MVTGGTDNLPQVVRVAQRQETLGDWTISRVDLPCSHPLVPTALRQPKRLSVPPQKQVVTGVACHPRSARWARPANAGNIGSDAGKQHRGTIRSIQP